MCAVNGDCSDSLRIRRSLDRVNKLVAMDVVSNAGVDSYVGSRTSSDVAVVPRFAGTQRKTPPRFGCVPFLDDARAQVDSFEDRASNPSSQPAFDGRRRIFKRGQGGSNEGEHPGPQPRGRGDRNPRARWWVRNVVQHVAPLHLCLPLHDHPRRPGANLAFSADAGRRRSGSSGRPARRPPRSTTINTIVRHCEESKSPMSKRSETSLHASHP